MEQVEKQKLRLKVKQKLQQSFFYSEEKAEEILQQHFETALKCGYKKPKYVFEFIVATW